MGQDTRQRGKLAARQDLASTSTSVSKGVNLTWQVNISNWLTRLLCSRQNRALRGVATGSSTRRVVTGPGATSWLGPSGFFFNFLGPQRTCAQWRKVCAPTPELAPAFPVAK